MLPYTIRIGVKVTCHKCHGKGLLIGPGRIIEGVYLQGERDCDNCDARGYNVERVELDAATLRVIADAIDTVRSLEYAEYESRHSQWKA